MRATATDVCVSPCRAQPWTVQKRLNGTKCRKSEGDTKVTAEKRQMKSMWGAQKEDSQSWRDWDKVDGGKLEVGSRHMVKHIERNSMRMTEVNACFEEAEQVGLNRVTRKRWLRSIYRLVVNDWLQTDATGDLPRAHAATCADWRK